MSRWWGYVFVLGMATACHGDAARTQAAGSTVPSAPTDGAEPTIGAGDTIAPHTHRATPLRTAGGRGAPHSSVIDRIALTRDGRAALTRDSIGGVRVWPSLDGRHQPQPVPMRHAAYLSVERHKSGLTLGLIDSAGGAHVLRLTGRGLATLGATSPHAPAVQIEILPGGEHAIVLGKDSSLSLITAAGAVVSTLEKARFRARGFEVARDGKSMRVMLLDTDGKKPEVTLARVAITPTRAPHLSVVGKATAFTGAAALGHAGAALSPTGNRFAFIEFTQATRTWNVVVVQPDTGIKRTIKTELPLTGNQAIGFIGEDKLIMGGHPRGSSWLLDLSSDQLRARPSPVGHFSNQPTPVAFAGGRRVVGIQGWLFVQQGDTGKHHYLGHEPFRPVSAALAPDGSAVAWFGSFGSVFVEPRDAAGAVVHLQTTRTSPLTRGFFLDRKHLLVANSLGTLSIIDWASNKTIAKTSAGGIFRTIAISRNRKLLHVMLNTNEARVFDVSAAGFVGPYLIGDDSTMSGLLEPTAATAPVVWSRDQKEKYRTYTLAELRQGMTRAQMLGRGHDLPKRPQHVLWTIGRDGARYYTHKLGQTGAELRIYADGKLQHGVAIPHTRRPSKLVPAPDSRRVAVSWSDGTISVVERGTGSIEWSHAFGTAVTDIRWSPDSSELAVTGTMGAAIFDAKTGTKKHRTCGPSFGVHTGVPSPTFGNAQQVNICEP